MTIKREYLLLVVALLLGFVAGAWYNKANGASLVLAGIANGGSTKTGTNGTATIPVYGMVTAAQGLDQGGPS
jgi:hypothetical protein